MSNPQPGTDAHVDGIHVTPDSIVLQNRPLRTTSSPLSRFGDPVWNLFPAIPDLHDSIHNICWKSYPAVFQLPIKFYVFALLNVVDYAPRIATARTTVPSIKTIYADLGYLRRFLHWLIKQNITEVTQITETDLDLYYAHVIATPGTPARRRKQLLAVQRLYYYGDFLPPFCRINVPAIWGGASAAQLADATSITELENRTPRIPPDTMSTLLSAALIVTETIASDIRPVVRQMIAMRTLAIEVAPTVRRQRSRETSRWFTARAQLAEVIAAYRQAQHPLPGRRENNRVSVDLKALAMAAQVDYDMLQRNCGGDLLAECGLPVVKDLLRIPRVGRINGQKWRPDPIETAELPTLIRHITAACFIVVAYLSGIRTGEALNLRRGCVTQDDKLDMIFLSGRQLKVAPDRTERSPNTIPWVINGPVAQAITVLEDFAPKSLIFPTGQFGFPEWVRSERTRTTGSINDDITGFITWFNTIIADKIDHPPIPNDRHGNITGMRLRRTLAWHIVRRPGGTVAGATQYGHLYSQITNGYAGQADAGFVDEISFEQFLARTEQIHDDHQLLAEGEHVSGPAAGIYRDRIHQAQSQFGGITAASKAQAAKSLANPNLQIHHGKLITCVWRPETAACARTTQHSPNGPAWSRCRPTCSNIAYTDRDVIQLRKHVTMLETELAAEVLPMPLHQRISAHLAQHKSAIRNHKSSNAR